MDAGSGAEDGSTPTATLSRRAALAGTATALSVGAAGTAAGQESGPAQVPDFGGWFSGDVKGGQTTSFTGTADERGSDAVTFQAFFGGSASGPSPLP